MARTRAASRRLASKLNYPFHAPMSRTDLPRRSSAEDRLSFSAEHFQRFATGGDDPIPEVDGVKPVVLLRAREQLRCKPLEWRLAWWRFGLGRLPGISPAQKEPLHVRLQLCHCVALAML